MHNFHDAMMTIRIYRMEQMPIEARITKSKGQRKPKRIDLHRAHNKTIRAMKQR